MKYEHEQVTYKAIKNNSLITVYRGHLGHLIIFLTIVYVIYCQMILFFSITSQFPQTQITLEENGYTETQTLHMVQCVFGNNTEFIKEWEVSFKSIIFNAPLDSNLHVHIFGNGDGINAVKHKILQTNLLKSRWRNQISVTITNLESKTSNIIDFLKNMILDKENNKKEWMDQRLGLGAFMRLFAYKYIMEYANNSTSVKRKDLRSHVFYLDVDIVILANLNHLLLSSDNAWLQIERKNKKTSKPDPIWMWGQGNTGFLGINVLGFDRFWKAVSQCETIKKDTYPKKNDQWLAQHVWKCFPDLQILLPHPSPWSIHLGHGYRQWPNNLKEERSTAGMLHLQLPETSSWWSYGIDYICRRSKCNHTDSDKLDAVRNSWGLADYYLRVDWNWTIYQSGESRLRPHEKGYKFLLVVRNGTSDFY